jgi:hypothetical protein
MPRSVCATCKHWDGHMAIDMTWDDGICRRYPPRGPGFGWPVTTHDEYCGEHTLRPPDVDEMFSGRE